MSIQKRSWTTKKGVQYRYYACVWNPGTNKPIYGKQRKKRKEAVLDESQILKELASGKLSVTDHKTFGQCADLWLESAPNLYRNSTYTTYVSFYNRHIKNVFENAQIDHIQSIQIQELVNTMSKNYAPETVNKCINILSDIFQFAIQPLKALPGSENPMIGIKRLKVPYKKKVTWTDEQIAQFLTDPEIKANHYYPMFCISLILGMRPG